VKILVADDNLEVRRLIKTLIADIAGEIFEAGDGGAAIDTYRTQKPDIVLMDVFMKQMDGITALKTIKQEDENARIIIVTNHADKRTRQAAMDAGAYAFFDKDDLITLVTLLKTL
jgi:CheY-like chemotaxis protein